MSTAVSSSLWVSALVRRANIAGAFSTIARKGDPERGDVLVRVYAAMGDVKLYGRTFSSDDEQTFTRLPEGNPVSTEQDCASYIARRIEYDLDIWIVDIEDRDGRHFLTEKVVGDA